MTWSFLEHYHRDFYAPAHMATCPFCRRGSLRIIAAMTQELVITRILRHCKLAAVPPPIAPTLHWCQRQKQLSGWWSPRSFSETGRRKAAAPATPSIARLAHLKPPVQTAKSRATPCCALLRCAADGCWRSRRRCAQAAATGGEHEDAPGVFFRVAFQKDRR
jgi:hypothetical protein